VPPWIARAVHDPHPRITTSNIGSAAAEPVPALAHDTLATNGSARTVARPESGAIRIEENMAPRRDLGQHRREISACILHCAHSFRLA
jgi:hypothetical protein